jgi:hypothetical protein
MRWLVCLAVAFLLGGCGNGDAGSGAASGSNGGPGDAGSGSASGGNGGLAAEGEGGSGVSWTEDAFGPGGAGGICGDSDVIGRYDACRDATDTATCAERGGTWRDSFAGTYCDCLAEDAGCACTSDTECALGCYAEPPVGAPPLGDCPGIVAGRCVAYQVFGCWCTFRDGVASGICIDPL